MSDVVKSGRRIGYIIGGVFSLISALLLFMLFFPEFFFQLTGDRPWNIKTAFSETFGEDLLASIKEWGVLILLSILFVVFLSATCFRQSASSTFLRIASIFGILSLLIPVIFQILSDVSETTDLLDLIGITRLICFAVALISLVLGIVFWITHKYNVNRASTLLVFNGIFWTVTAFFIGIEGINSVFDGGFEFHKTVVKAFTMSQSCMGYLSIYLFASGIWMLCTIPNRFLRESPKSKVVMVNKGQTQTSPFGTERSKVRTLADLDEENKEKSRFESPKRTVSQPYTNTEQVATNRPLPAFRPVSEEESTRRPTSSSTTINPFLQNVPVGRRPQEENSSVGVTSGNANRPLSAPPVDNTSTTDNSNPYSALFNTSNNTETSTTNSSTTQVNNAYNTTNNVTTQPDNADGTFNSQHSAATTEKYSQNNNANTAQQSNTNRGAYEALFGESKSSTNNTTVNNTTTNTTVNNYTTTNTTTQSNNANTNKGTADLWGAAAASSTTTNNTTNAQNSSATTNPYADQSTQKSTTQGSAYDDLLSSPYAASTTSKNKPTDLEFSRIPEQTPPAEIKDKQPQTTHYVEKTTIINNTVVEKQVAPVEKQQTTQVVEKQVTPVVEKETTKVVEKEVTPVVEKETTKVVEKQVIPTVVEKPKKTKKSTDTTGSDTTTTGTDTNATTGTINTGTVNVGSVSTGKGDTGTNTDPNGGVLPFGGVESEGPKSILPQAYYEASMAGTKPRKPRKPSVRRKRANTFLMGMGQRAFMSTGDDIDASGLIIS